MSSTLKASSVLFLMLIAVVHVSSEHYHIVPKSYTFLCKYYLPGTCFVLDQYPVHIKGEVNNLTLSFLPGEHQLSQNLKIGGADDALANVTFNSETLSIIPYSTPRIFCHEYNGFDFDNFYNIAIIGLEISGSKSKRAMTMHRSEFVSVVDCLFTNNHVNGVELYGGGAVRFFEVQTVLIQRSWFVNNSALNCARCEGGAVLVQLGRIVTIDSSYFIHNTASALGGAFTWGLFRELQNYTLTVTNTSFTNNWVASTIEEQDGGAINFGGGPTFIKNCSFTNNSAGRNGGAIAFESLYAVFNLTVIQTQFINNSAVGNAGGAISVVNGFVTVTNCIFFGNSASKSGGGMLVQEVLLRSSGNYYSQNLCLSMNGSGGAVYARSEAYFQDDYFSENGAMLGAAIHHIYELNIDISDTTFVENAIVSESSGVVHVSVSMVSFKGNVFFCNNRGSLFIYSCQVEFHGNTTFENNVYKKGGAIASVASEITFETTSRTIVAGNVAVYGGAFYLTETIGHILNPILITNNTADISGGAVYAIQSVIEFDLLPVPIGEVFVPSLYITNNQAYDDGGAFYLIASSVRISNSYIYIQNNTAGHHGGGIYLEQTSNIDLNKKRPEHSDDNSLYIQLKFIENSAKRGGAIYVSDSTSSGGICKTNHAPNQTHPITQYCFLQTLLDHGYEENFNPSLIIVNTYFYKNAAVEEGSDLYGGLLDRCAISPLTELFQLGYKSLNGLEYLNATARFNQEDKPICDFYNYISSDAVRVCFCIDGHKDCSATHPTVIKKKGERFTLMVVAVDQVGKPVNTTLMSSLQPKIGQIQRFKEGQEARYIRDKCTELEYNVYASGKSTEMQLYADGPCENQGISKQVITISFKPCDCLVGLERISSKIDCQCVCDSKIKQFVSNCSENTGTIQVNANIWIEYVNTTNASGFLTEPCPFDYCAKRPVNITFADQNETDKQCAFKRTQMLCGKCAKGLSFVFASSRCQKCSNYYLLLLLPFMAAGVMLVAVILLINMTVVTGTVYGLIFYANLVAANRSIFLPFDTPNVLTTFIAWLNLDLGIETCFYDGMDSYGKFLLQLVFPSYIFLLIIIIILACSHFQQVAKLIGRGNPEATLYTLIFLSYSKLIRIIITALQFTTLHYPDGTQKIVWLYDANVMYFSLSHIPRFLAAFAIIVFGLLYTSLLLLRQIIHKCISHHYYTHFVNAYHAPLSDRHQYWVGLLLLARIVHYLVSSFASESVVILFAGAMVIILLLYKLLIRPSIYKSVTIDWLETSFFVNIIVLALSTLFIRDDNGNQQILAFLSMSVSFITFMGIVLYHITKKCGNDVIERKGRQLMGSIAHAFQQCRDCGCTHNEESAVTNAESVDSDHDDNIERQQLLDTEDALVYTETRPTIERTGPASYYTQPIIRRAQRDDQLREPALDVLLPVQPEDYCLPSVSQSQRRELITFAEIDIRAEQN